MQALNLLKKNQLIKSGILYIIGGFMIRGINFITIPIFTRMLNSYDYGITNIFSTWLAFIVIIGGLELCSSIPTAKVKLKYEDYEDLIVTILSFSTLVFSLLFVICIIWSEKISFFIGLDQELLILLIIQGFFTFVIQTYTTKLIQEKKDKKYLIVSFCSTLANIGISIILIFILKESLYLGKIIGTTIGSSIIGLIIYINLLKSGFFINMNCLKFALSLSIPIIPHIISHQILTNSDRIMLLNFTSESEVGIYSFTYNIGMIINILWSAMNSAWVPWYYQNLKENLFTKVNKAIKYYIILFLFITSIIIFISPEIVKILAPKEYWIGINIVPIVIVSYYFQFLYTFSINMEYYLEKTKYIPIGTLIAAIINLILNIIFIPKYGIIAAVITTLISYLSLYVFHIIISKKIGIEEINLKHQIGSIFILSIVVMIFYLVIDKIVYRYFILILAIISLMILFYNKITKN